MLLYIIKHKILLAWNFIYNGFVHKMRNILNKTRPKDKEMLASDFKEVFNNFHEGDTIEKAKVKVEVSCKKWERIYPKIRRFFDERSLDHLFTYIEFPSRVRRMIYTTNSLENVNHLIREGAKNKLSFESPDTLLDYVFMIIKDFEERNFMKFAVHKFKYFH